MAKGAYIGVNGVARKVKKMYVGVGGVARRVKKAYIGVGGVARPFWAGGELSYYGQILPPTEDVSYRGSISFQNHAVFAGGYVDTDIEGTKNVWAYDKDLTRSQPFSLTESRGRVNAARVDNYAIITGANAYDQTTTVDICNTDFTIWSTNVSNYGYQEAVCSSPSFGAVVFGCSNFYVTEACMWRHRDDGQLDSGVIINLQLAGIYDLPNYPAATHTTNHALATGYYDGASKPWVVVVNSDATAMRLDTFTPGRQWPKAAHFCGKAVFAGGFDSSGDDYWDYIYYHDVQCYDDDLVHTWAPNLKEHGDPLYSENSVRGFDGSMGGTLENHLIFTGARTGTASVYDTDFTMSAKYDCGTLHMSSVPANVGKYLLFANNRRDEQGCQVHAFTEI